MFASRQCTAVLSREGFVVLAYVRPNSVRLNIVSLRYHLTEQAVHESMRALLIVRTAPSACIDTCWLHLILKTLCDQHLVTNMHVCAVMSNERTYGHERQANGARATNMPACIDQTSILKDKKNMQSTIGSVNT